MKKLAFGTLMIVGLLAACGGDDGVIPLPDAPPGDGPSVCNPLGAPGQQGCLAGQKCTWISIQETPEALGKLGCVADGTVALDGACEYGPVGETTGFDNCQAGLYCINNTCRDVCGFDGSTAAACATGFNCTAYQDTFANGMDEPVAGVCNPGCDPLTQFKTGTTDTCGTGMGCYVLARRTGSVAVCASAGRYMHNQDVPTAELAANSCVPGAVLRGKDAVSETIQCGGLCKMVDVTSTLNTESEGGQVTQSTTDKDNCQATWGADPPTDGVSGESCRFFWAYEPSSAPISQFSNTIGWCFKHAVFDYDTNGDMMDDANFPRCIEVTTGDVLPPIDTAMPHNDAIYFWCNQVPTMLQGAVKNIKSMHARHVPQMEKVVDHARLH